MTEVSASPGSPSRVPDSNTLLRPQDVRAIVGPHASILEDRVKVWAGHLLKASIFLIVSARA